MQSPHTPHRVSPIHGINSPLLPGQKTARHCPRSCNTRQTPPAGTCDHHRDMNGAQAVSTAVRSPDYRAKRPQEPHTIFSRCHHRHNNSVTGQRKWKGGTHTVCHYSATLHPLSQSCMKRRKRGVTCTMRSACIRHSVAPVPRSPPGFQAETPTRTGSQRWECVQVDCCTPPSTTHTHTRIFVHMSTHARFKHIYMQKKKIHSNTHMLAYACTHSHSHSHMHPTRTYTYTSAH